MATATLIERIRRFPSPCLRRQLADAGIEPADYRREDLERLPPLEPGCLHVERVDDPVADLRLSDAPSPVRLGTSQRGGSVVVLTWTARDLRRIADSGAALLAHAGVEPGQIVANTLEGGFSTPGSLLLGDAVEALGAVDVPLGPLTDDRAAKGALDLLLRIAVDVLVLDRSTASGLLPILRKRWPPSLRGVVWLGNDRPQTRFPGWWRRWLSVAEIAPFAAIDCEQGALHLDVGVGVETANGRILFSAVEGDTPLLRFDPGMRGRLSSRCACGAGGFVVEVDSEPGDFPDPV